MRNVALPHRETRLPPAEDPRAPSELDLLVLLEHARQAPRGEHEACVDEAVEHLRGRLDDLRAPRWRWHQAVSACITEAKVARRASLAVPQCDHVATQEREAEERDVMRERVERDVMRERVETDSRGKMWHWRCWPHREAQDMGEEARAMESLGRGTTCGGASMESHINMQGRVRACEHAREHLRKDRESTAQNNCRTRCE